MGGNRWLNIAALGLVVLAGSCSGSQPRVSEFTPTSGTAESPTIEPSATPTEASTPTLAATETPPGSEKVQIIWYGLGAGSMDSLIPLEEKFVDQFNASQDHIELVLEANEESNSTEDLATRIANEATYGWPAPDIVGPIGIAGRDRFKGEWLDLTPLIEANQYDLSDFDPTSVKIHEVAGEGLLSLPLAIYPSFILMNKNLFDAAGLPYAPQEFGAPYVDEKGKQHGWNTDTLRELAMQLTVDMNGNDATNPAFDPTNIVQFGFLSQFTDMRGALTMFGPGSLIDDSGNAQMPNHWREGAHWIYDAMWKDHFWPTDDYMADLLATPNPFASGHLAMAQVQSWYVEQWAMSDIDFVWDTAVMPSYHGTTTAKMQADNFYILKDSKHPQEAFEVLTYMLSQEHAPELLAIYSNPRFSGGVPARLSLQDAYFESRRAMGFPGQDINWQVMIDSAAYADIPNHESGPPHSLEVDAKLINYWWRWSQESNLDLDAEIDALLVDLQAIFDRPD